MFFRKVYCSICHKKIHLWEKVRLQDKYIHPGFWWNEIMHIKCLSESERNRKDDDDDDGSNYDKIEID